MKKDNISPNTANYLVLFALLVHLPQKLGQFSVHFAIVAHIKIYLVKIAVYNVKKDIIKMSEKKHFVNHV